MKTKLTPETERLLQEAYDWMLVLENTGVTADERQEFEAWLASDPRHGDVYDQAVTVKAAFSSLSSDDFDERVHRQTLRERAITFYDQTKLLFANTRLQVAAAGAAMAGAAAMIFLTTLTGTRLEAPAEQPVIVAMQTEIGETKTVMLTDGSTVILAPSSSIEASYTREQRDVELLGGAAYFTVTEDPARPFSVKAGLLTATALGTSFDVKKSAGVFRVGVSEGQVGVSYPLTLNGRSTSMMSSKVLEAGQQVAATIEAGLRSVSVIKPEQVAGWREGRLTYSGAPVAELVADANRYSSVPIVVADGSEHILNLEIRGVFRGDDVNQILESLTAIHSIQVDRSDASRILLSAHGSP